MPNPNYGRPVMGGNTGGNALTNDHDAFRIQAYGDIHFKDFMNEDSLLTKLLGPLTITGLMDESSHFPAAFFASKRLTEVESKVLVAQSHLWDNTIVLTGTWRSDSGKTEEMGFTVGALDGKLLARFNWFETTAANNRFETSYNLGEFEDVNILKHLGNITVGGGIRWQDKVGIGFNVAQNALGDYARDLNQPYWAYSLMFMDVFARFRWNLARDREFALQINIKDLTNNAGLQPFVANPDGSKLYRIMEGRLFTASATYSF